MFEIIGILLTSFFMNGCQTSDQDDDVATDDAADVAAFLLVMALMKWGKKEKEWKLTTIDEPGDVGQFSSLAIDSNNKLHVTYIDSTNSDLKYATYDTTASSWSPPITLDPATSGRYSSLAIDSNNKLHVTYYGLNDYLMCATYNTVGWGVGKEVDSSGDVGQFSSLAIDSNNNLHATYFDAANGNLMYATRTTASSWIRTTVDSASAVVGQYSSLAIDSNDKLHVTYYDGVNDNLKYATADAAFSSSWMLIYSNPRATGGRYSSLAIDSNDKLHVTYYGSYNGDLMYGTYDTTASSWNPITVDSALTTGPGRWSSLAIDSNDKLHVTYYDATNGNLMYATYDTTTSSWILTIVDNTLGAVVGEFSSLAIDSNNKLHVTYYDVTNKNLKYAVFS